MADTLELVMRGRDEGASRMVGTLGDSLRRVGEFVAGNLIAGGISRLSAGFADAARSGLSMNNSLEQVKAQLNAFTKDGAKSAEILAMIRDRAAKTPFEFDAMARSTAALLPAAKAANHSLDDLVATSEILAASNPAEGLEGAAFALKEALGGDFVSIVERFNLPRQRLNQLKKEGVPAIQAVQIAMKEMGLDADLVGNMAVTMSGRWSTFKDTLVGLYATMTEPAFEMFSSGLGDLQKVLDANQGSLSALAASIGRGVGSALASLARTVLPLAIRGFDLLRDGVKTLQEAWSGKWVDSDVIHPFHRAIGIVGTFAKRLADAVNESEGQSTGGRAAGILAALGLDEGTAGSVGRTVDTVVAAVQEGKRRLSEAVSGFQAGQAAGPGVATINFLTALGLPEDPAVRIGVFVADTERALTDAKTRLQAAIAAFREGQGPQGILVALGFSEETTTTILQVAGQIQQVLGAVGAQIAGTWDSMARAAAPLVPVFQELLVALTPVGQFLGGVLLGAIGRVTGAIPGLINIITGLVTALTGGVQIMTGLFGLFVNTIVKLLMGDFAGAWEQAKTSIGNIMSGIGNILLGGIEIIAGILRTLIGAVVGAFTTLYDAVVGHSIVPDMVNAIVDWFAQLPGRVGEWVRQVVSDTVAKFGELAGQAVRLGSDIVGGVVQGVKDAGGRLFDSLRNLAGNALDAAKGALGIKSPSTVFAAEVGIPIVQGITQGILAGERGLSDAVVTILRSMSRLAMEVDLADILGKNDLARLDALADGLGRVANVTKSLQDIMSGGVSLRDFIQEQLALDLPALDLGAARAWADRLSEWATAISNVVTSRTAGIPDAAQAITERAASVIGQVRDSIRASFDLARFMEEAQGGRPLRMDAEAASRLASSLGAYASGVVNAYAASLGALPRGQSLTPALAGAGGASGGTLSSAAEGGITVHINIDKLDSSIDLEVLANRVATVIAARMR